MKKISSGILILNEFDEVLLGHATGHSHYDLPKGCPEENEDSLTCALRECEEETGLKIDPFKLKHLRIFDYQDDKDVSIFLYDVKKLDIDFEALHCASTFLDSFGIEHPEFDEYLWAPLSRIHMYCGKNMTRVIKEIVKEYLVNA